MSFHFQCCYRCCFCCNSEWKNCINYKCEIDIWGTWNVEIKTMNGTGKRMFLIFHIISPWNLRLYHHCRFHYPPLCDLLQYLCEKSFENYLFSTKISEKVKFSLLFRHIGILLIFPSRILSKKNKTFHFPFVCFLSHTL